jgi:hypothetical protein
MVLAPTVCQGFGLAGVASASSVGSAGLLTFHLLIPVSDCFVRDHPSLVLLKVKRARQSYQGHEPRLHRTSTTQGLERLKQLDA